MFNLDAHTESGSNQLITSNHLIWDSTSTWTKDGSINVNSSFVYMNGVDLNWNSISHMKYGSHSYQISTKNIDLNSIENLYCYGNGGYGGTFMNW